MYSNVDNSLLSKLDELRVLTHTNKYGIITLTEINPKHGTLPDPKSLQINGYTLYLGDLDNTNSRGVCCYVNDKLSSEIILIREQYNDSVWVRLLVDVQSTCPCLAFLIQNYMRPTDEGDISDITYSPRIGKSDHIRLQLYLYTNIRRHIGSPFDKAVYSKMREMMLMINWTQHPHTHHIVAPGFVDRPRRSDCTAGQMDGEAGWWTTSGNI